MRNSNLLAAKINKNDKFFTQLVDIEKELSHYTDQFKGKVIYCNCDTEESNFVKYFRNNKTIKKLLYSSNDFRDNIELLKQADIVVTNPPFSLFREYIAQLMEHKKKFLVIGNMNAIICKEIFPLIKDDKLWWGYNCVRHFGIPNGKIVEGARSFWYTNLSHKNRNEKFILTKTYKGNKSDYPKYDNYDAIEVSKAINIPKDFTGIMGVPITFLDKYNPNQFKIIWQASGNTRASTDSKILDRLGYKPHDKDRGGCGIINNDKRVYSRLLIKHRKN